jgi:hypothetical protein
MAYPDPKHYLHERISRLMAHSIHMTAALALHSANVPVEDIAFHLHWSVESVKYYSCKCQVQIGSLMQAAVAGAMMAIKAYTKLGIFLPFPFYIRFIFSLFFCGFSFSLHKCGGFPSPAVRAL